MKFLRDLYFKSGVHFGVNEQAFPTGHVKPRLAVHVVQYAECSSDCSARFGHICGLFPCFFLGEILVDCSKYHNPNFMEIKCGEGIFSMSFFT